MKEKKANEAMDVVSLVTGAGVMLVVISLFIAGCTTVGSGHETIIKEINESAALRLRFPHLIVKDMQDRVVDVMAGEYTARPKKYKEFQQYLKRKYGDSSIRPAELQLAVRNRGVTPPFLPVDVKIPDKLIELYMRESKLSHNERLDIEQLVKARLFNVPDLEPRTTVHHYDSEGRKVFYTYPRLQIEFSSSLLSPTLLDRFEFLGLVVKLESHHRVERERQVQIVDFSPKAADMVEYARGQLTQVGQMSAKGSIGRTGSLEEGSEFTSAASDSKTTRVGAATSTIGAELSSTLSDQLLASDHVGKYNVMC